MINENTPLLQTERLILRKLTPNDITPLFELLSDEDVNTFLPWFPVKHRKKQPYFYSSDSCLIMTSLPHTSTQSV